MRTCNTCKGIMEEDKFEVGRSTCRECRIKKRNSKYKHTCLQCNDLFTSAKKCSKYCSKKCAGAAKVSKVSVQCSYCGKDKLVVPSLHDRLTDFYCNQSCKNHHMKITMAGESNPNYARIDSKCDGCGVDIKLQPCLIKDSKRNFCTYSCYQKNIGRFYSGENNHNYTRSKFNCNECGTQFEDVPSSRKRSNATYCSNDCYLKFVSKRMAEVKSKNTISCVVCSKEFHRKPNESKSRMNNCCSRVCMGKLRATLYLKENHPRWDKTKPQIDRVVKRKYYEYSLWRTSVFTRDKFTCKCCGDKTGGNLIAHHILNYSEHRRLALDTNNGITLCKSCHKSFHDEFGYTKNNLSQLTLFMKSHSKGP